jgi:hypothetical protein
MTSENIALYKFKIRKIELIVHFESIKVVCFLYAFNNLYIQIHIRSQKQEI